jgi:hypothetical protein
VGFGGGIGNTRTLGSILVGCPQNDSFAQRKIQYTGKIEVLGVGKSTARWLRSGQAGMAVPQGGREKELDKTTVALERKTHL